MADAELHSVDAIDWDYFYLGNVKHLIAQCLKAFGVTEKIFFTDEAPLQASYNYIDLDDISASRICIGVGNLESYPYSTLIAVLLHELGHYFSYRSIHWQTIHASAQLSQIELLADYLAGAAFAAMEGHRIKISERVIGQCSELALPGMSSPAIREQARKQSKSVILNPRKLLRAGKGQAKFEIIRSDGKIEPLQNYAMIGTMPDEDPTETTCVTTQHRSVDFLSMVGAAAAWRTFGDRPNTASHGTPQERYEAFSSGYQGGRQGRSLSESLKAGMSNLQITI